MASLAASVMAYAVGMLTFDAFAFIQVTFLFFMLLALGAAALRTPVEPVELDRGERARAARRRRRAAELDQQVAPRRPGEEDPARVVRAALRLMRDAAPWAGTAGRPVVIPRTARA